MMAPRRPHPHYLINLALSMAALGLFAVAGVRVANTTSAATSNPYGQADYCALEDNMTVIYGWAADPDAGSLGQPSVIINAGPMEITAGTNRTHYREAAINAWIEQNRNGDPKRGTYGFRAVVPGLYKGTRHPVSGTVLNEGAGTSVILTVNNSSPIDDDAKKPFFRDNLIPEECLADPAKTPAATPAASSTAPQPKSTDSNTAGTTVTVGTLAADLRVRVGTAATVRIIYGESPVKLENSSSEFPVRGNETTIALTGLKPATSYAYRVIRTDTLGKQTTSPAASFTTLGFVVALHFTDNKNIGLQGIPVSMAGVETKKTSSETGDVQFTNVQEGRHVITYSYLNTRITRTVTVDTSTLSPIEITAARVITVDSTINIEASPASIQEMALPKNDRAAGVLITTLGGFALVILMTLLLLRKQRHRKIVRRAILNSPPPPLPEYHPLTPKAPPIVPGELGAEHMGQSLKELVIKSMKENPKR